MRQLCVAVLALAAILCGPAARADLVVTIDDGTVAVNGSGFVNVWIESTDPSGEDLFSYSLEFQITASPSNTGLNDLQFSDPQSGDFLTDSDYVFAGVSESAGPPISAPSVVGTTLFAGDNVNTTPGSNVLVTQTKKLLIRLELSAQLLALEPGDSYSVTLLNTGFTGFTRFVDVTTGPAPVSFRSVSGLVTITAVPEPATMLLVVMGWPLQRLVRRVGRNRVAA